MRQRGRLAGVFYLLTIVTGAFAALSNSRLYSNTANLIATACYVAVTLILYTIFKPVNRSLSLLAACFSLFGCALGALDAFHLNPIHVNTLVFFGFYCLLIGYLIFKSTLLPRFLGVLMAIAGLGWLTFLSAQLANHLSPYTMVSGLLGEGSLTLWLLVAGVNAPDGVSDSR
jgi:Domain of unknown function (DUF4386)